MPDQGATPGQLWMPLEPASSRHGTSHHARAPDPAGPSSGRPAVLRQMTSIISHFADVSSKPPRGPAPTFPRHRREHCVTRLGCGNLTVRGMAVSSPQNPPTPPGGGGKLCATRHGRGGVTVCRMVFIRATRASISPPCQPSHSPAVAGGDGDQDGGSVIRPSRPARRGGRNARLSYRLAPLSADSRER